jgi:serine/threonine-protein kinase
VRSLRPDVPVELAALVAELLAKEPKDRPQTAADLARTLEAIDVLAWGDEEAARWWSTAGLSSRQLTPP